MNRRSFLKIAAASAAAAAVLPSASAASKRNLRKAIMYSTIGVKGSVLEKFRVMKEAGFEGVEPMGGINRDRERREQLHHVTRAGDRISRRDQQRVGGLAFRYRQRGSRRTGGKVD